MHINAYGDYAKMEENGKSGIKTLKPLRRKGPSTRTRRVPPLAQHFFYFTRNVTVTPALTQIFAACTTVGASMAASAPKVFREKLFTPLS